MRIYIVAAIFAAFFAFYYAGVRIGRERCHADNAVRGVEIQNQTIETMERINAEAYNTGVADIRDVLRAKYTISQ